MLLNMCWMQYYMHNYVLPICNYNYHKWVGQNGGHIWITAVHHGDTWPVFLPHEIWGVWYMMGMWEQAQVLQGSGGVE